MECGTWPELDLGVLAQEQLARLAGRRYPLTGSLELTERCNLQCVHCFINQPAAHQAVGARELSTAEVETILDKVADAGCLYLLLTGGEPLLRRDFHDVYLYAVRKGLLLTLFTNGTLLNAELADLLAEWRPHSVEITLYGSTQRTYERVTQVPGSYASCMRGIELALDRGLPLRLKTMVLRANCDELQEMKALAAQLGVAFRFDGMLWPRRDGGLRPYDQRLSPQELVALDQDDPDRMLEWQDVLRSTPKAVRAESVFSCGAGRFSFHVDCAGKMSACMMARSPAFDLLRGSFDEGWERCIGAAIREKRSVDTACRACGIGVLCTQCPGWSQMIHGDNETPVEFVCEVGHLRAAQFDLSS